MPEALKLLLIDDDAVDRMAIMRALPHCTLVQAENAEMGIKSAALQHFDAILLDYVLPQKNGLEVLKTLRNEKFGDVAIIMISNQDDETIASNCIEAGAQDFLLKNEVNNRTLARAVRHARQRYLIEHALRSSSAELLQLAEHDPLTGLSNRRGFEKALDAAISRVHRDHDRLAILLLDLDDFKTVNDTLGHDAGDQCLIEVAHRLNSIVRGSDLLCRLGGDEFVMLVSHFEHDEQTALLAERIIKVLQHPMVLGSIEHVVTASIGIAIFDRCVKSTMDLLKYADVAMYQAKKNGRNQSHFYSNDLENAVKLRSNIKHDLVRALEQNEFEVYYQPKINPHDGKLHGMEALLRWNNKKLGLLTPAYFMSIAEETGHIIDIGDWVLKHSCQQLLVWQTKYADRFPDLSLSVNLSAVQITLAVIEPLVEYIANTFPLQKNSLELEITESALIKDAASSATLLNKLTQHGISISLDDFGTGYCSLEYLKLFPVSVLKIDQSFIASIGKEKRDELLLVALIAFAKALSMKVVAEGVETLQQAHFCAQHGCDLLQGFFYSPPLSAEDFERTFLAAPTLQRI